MSTGPPIKRRALRATGAGGRRASATKRPGKPGAPPEPDRSRERRRLVVGALVTVALLTSVGIVARQWRAPKGPPAEVERIADGIRKAGHQVQRVARNANGGWSVLLDDGEVQWFKNPSKVEAQLHPIRVLYEMRHDPNVVVLDLHPTVFSIVLSGRRQGSTLELGTARTGAAEIAAMVQSAVSGARR